MPHPIPAQALVRDTELRHSAPVDLDWGSAWDAAMRREDFAGAWAVNDAVLAARDMATRDDPAVPYHLRWVWDGTPVAGRHVVVRCYHGLGDTLMFGRYLAPLRLVAASVTLEVQAPLAEILAGWADRVVPFDWAAPIPRGACDVEVMELGHALRLVPEAGAYLARPGVGRGGVGLCWAAGGWDADRDMPAAALRPLVAGLLEEGQFKAGQIKAGRRVVSLQRGRAAAEAVGIGVGDPLGGSMDMAALAGLVAGLDAVVTVDTMVAHLAGAMGVPVFLLLKAEADWRWGSGERTGWYGSARLFRQREAGDWAGVVRDLSFSRAFEACCGARDSLGEPSGLRAGR